MLTMLSCRSCGDMVDMAAVKCRCSGGIPDLRPGTDIGDNHSMIYDQIASDDLLSPMQPDDSKAEKASADMRRLGPHLDTSRKLDILEIGPGDGHFLRLLGRFGRTVAADVTRVYLEKLGFADGRILAQIEHLPFEEQFDVIVLCDVLEHVLNEGDALLSLNRALRPGGIVFIRCPANEPLVGYSTHGGSPYPYVHLRTYSPRDLRRVVSFAGFQTLESGYSARVPIGFARRSFGIPALGRARAIRHTREVLSANGIDTVDANSRLDAVVTKVESATWYLLRRLPGSGRLERLLAAVWYRGSESFVVARKFEGVFSHEMMSTEGAST